MPLEDGCPGARCRWKVERVPAQSGRSTDRSGSATDQRKLVTESRQKGPACRSGLPNGRQGRGKSCVRRSGAGRLRYPRGHSYDLRSTTQVRKAGGEGVARGTLSRMIREPAELTVQADGTVELPMGLWAEAGLNPGSKMLAISDGDGRIVLRRFDDSVEDLLGGHGL